MPKLETKGNHLEIDGKRVLKGWESFSGWYWFGVEKVESDPGMWFGLVQGFEDEWGYFSEAELKSNRMIWKIKARDLPIAGRRQ